MMKMFNMIGIGERAGSGIPDIYQIWKNEGWAMPVVEEKYNPDRTCLTLTFEKKQAKKTSDKNKTRKTGCNKRIFTTKWFVKNECDVVAEGVNKNRKYHLFDESGLVRK